MTDAPVMMKDGMARPTGSDVRGWLLRGDVGMAIVVRVLGLILCALAIQFILAGLGEAIPGMFAGAVTSPYPAVGH